MYCTSSLWLLLFSHGPDKELTISTCRYLGQGYDSVLPSLELLLADLEKEEIPAVEETAVEEPIVAEPAVEEPADAQRNEPTAVDNIEPVQSESGVESEVEIQQVEEVASQDNGEPVVAHEQRLRGAASDEEPENAGDAEESEHNGEPDIAEKIEEEAEPVPEPVPEPVAESETSEALDEAEL